MFLDDIYRLNSFKIPKTPVEYVLTEPTTPVKYLRPYNDVSTVPTGLFIYLKTYRSPRVFLVYEHIFIVKNIKYFNNT